MIFYGIILNNLLSTFLLFVTVYLFVYFQIDLMGHSIYEFSHPCDHDEIKEILSVKSPLLPAIPRSFFIRMKCTLTNKGRNVNLKSASYRVGLIYSLYFSELKYIAVKWFDWGVCEERKKESKTYQMFVIR